MKGDCLVFVNKNDIASSGYIFAFLDIHSEMKVVAESISLVLLVL